MVRECWVIGDQLLDSAIKYFQPKKNNKDPPYLYKYYDVTYYLSTVSSDRLVISRLCNAFVIALNDKKKLPSLIVLMLDDEITKLTQYGERVVRWLYMEFARYITTFKEWVPARCTLENEPLVITVKSIPLPPWLDKNNYHKDDKTTLNGYINKVLQILLNIDAILPTDACYFTEAGTLTAAGYTTY